MVKKSQATKKPVNQAVSVSRIRLNKLILDSWLIIQGFFGIFIFLALSTFSTKDIGWNTQLFTSSSSAEYQVTNAVGSWGAYISDFLFTFLGFVLASSILIFILSQYLGDVNNSISLLLSIIFPQLST